MRITGKKWNQRLRENAPEQEMPWIYVAERCKREKTKRSFIRLVFRKKNKKKKNREQFSWVNWSDKRGWNIYFNLNPLSPTLCPARPFIVFRWGNVNTAKIIYHLSVIRIADRCNLQYCAKCKWRLSYIAQEGVGWGKQTSYVSMSHFSSRNVRKRIDEISELSRDYLKDISI